MPTSTDSARDATRLCDLADAASYLARSSYRLGDHADAAEAHRKAFRALQSSERPSLASNHLRRAADHDKIAHDADSFAQKDVLANAATKKADNDNTAGAHRAAARAHEAAAKAWRAENPKHREGSDWTARSHEDSAKRHNDTADFLDKEAGEQEDAASAAE